MLDHVSFGVRSFADSKAFYTAALAPIGIKPLFGDDKSYCGFGRERAQFWINTRDDGQPLSTATHIAVTAGSRAEVDAFYAAAIAAGAKDNGKPGLRPHYHPDYYGAFVIDLNGHNLEAVYRGR
jgi:predicted lactoylglutathione lyase